MGLAQQFTNMGEDFIASFNDRIKFLGENVVETKRIFNNTQKLLKHFHNEQKTMGRKLRTDLGNFMNNLTGNVGTMLNKFRKEQKTIRHDFNQAHQSWQQVSKAMAARRKNFNGLLAKAKQSASHAH